MRFVVFVFGLLGSLIAGGLAVGMLLFAATVMPEIIKFLESIGVGGDILQSFRGIRLTTMGYFLSLTAGLGLLGSILAVKRCGWQAGVLLLLGCVGPALLYIYILGPLSLLILAGLFAFLVRSKPAVA